MLTGWLLVTGASALSLLLGGGALAVKINATIILPFVCTRARRTIWIGTILLALPLALANSRTTGCLAYPAPLFCSNTPSSISPAETRQVSYEAVDQGRRGDSLTAWAGRWAVGLNRYALVLFALSLAVLIATRSWNRAASLAVGSYIFYFVVSPDIRFTFGPTALLAGCAGMATLPGIRIPRVPKEVWASLIAGGIVAADHAWESGRQQNGRSGPDASQSRLWIPSRADLTAGESRTIFQNGITYRMPVSGDQCGSRNIPCTPSKLNPLTRLCDPSEGLQGGFYRSLR